MKTKWFVTAGGAMIAASAALFAGGDGTPTTQPAAPINKFCAVMPEDPIDPKVTYIYQGKTIAFCCKECIADFKKDPEKYMAKLK